MNENRLVSASKDKTLRLWDLECFKCKFVLKADFGRFIPLAVDEQYIYTYSLKDGVILWSWKTGEIITKIKCNLGTRECSLAVDETHLYCGPYLANNKIRGIGIWSKNNWRLENYLPLNKGSKGKNGECMRIIIDGDHLYALGLLELIKWNLRDYEEILRWEPISADIYTFSLDSHYLYYGPFVFSRSSRHQIATLLEKEMREIHFVENDEKFVYMSSTDDPYGTVWQKNTWKLHQKLFLQPPNKNVEALAISDKYVFIGSAKDITIWSKEDWQYVQVLSGHSDWIWNLVPF
jgi:WD40 repeat protein